MTAPDTFVFGTLCAGAGTGAAIDFASRRIPNAVTAATAAAGLLLAIGGVSHVSVGDSLLGMTLGFALMLPAYLFGAMGAGDVKLFAAAGAVLGLDRVLPAFAAMAIAGGAIALFVAYRRGHLAHTIATTTRLIERPIETRADIRAHWSHNTFPYGPAIAIGCLIAVLWT